jgi:MinD-like ATPase involved in chromosome partitioning or flagellar assembly
LAIACGLTHDDGTALAEALCLPVDLLPDLTAMLRSLRGTRTETLVVLGPGIPDHQVWRFVGRARAASPETVVVLLRPTVNRMEHRLAREAGVDAILPATDVPAAARTCRALLAIRAERGRGRLVTVFAAKGGCGKTTIATNLAVALADCGRRVCLVDLNLRFGDVAAALGLVSRHTISSATPDGDVTPMITPVRPGLDCVLAPVGPGEAERLEVDGVDATLAALTRAYDVVVVDTPATFTRPVMAALDRAEHHVLVTTPERPALQSLRATLDTMDLLGYRRDSRSVVFNRSDSGAGMTSEDVDTTLRAPIAAHIPSSRDVAASINRCAPLMVTHPDHPVSAAIRALATTRMALPAAVARSPSGAR